MSETTMTVLILVSLFCNLICFLFISSLAKQHHELDEACGHLAAKVIAMEERPSK